MELELDDDADVDLLTRNNRNSTSNRLYFNFIIFCVLFSIVHATVDAILSFASTELGPQVGSYTSFLLFFSYTLSALFLAKPFLKYFTKKCGVVLGLSGLLIYVIAFLISLLVPLSSLIIFSVGASVGGITAGILWTSQGSYYSLNATRYAESVSKDDVSAKNSFSSIFAFTYLSFEALVMFLATLIYWLQKHGTIQGNNWKIIVFGMYSVTALISVIFFQIFVLNMDSTSDLQLKNTQNVYNDSISNTPQYTYKCCGLRNSSEKWTPNNIRTEFISVANMIYTSSCLRLLIPYQLMSGLSNGMVTFYVNREIVSAYVGDGYIGLLASLGVLSGAILTWPFNTISNTYVWGKRAVMILGGLCYFYIAITVLILKNSTMGSNWIFLVTYYIVHGAARGVWESTNKAVIAEYFITDAQREAAFATVYFTSGIAGAFGFLLYQFMDKFFITGLNVFMAVLAIVCYNLSYIKHYELPNSTRENQIDHNSINNVSVDERLDMLLPTNLVG